MFRTIRFLPLLGLAWLALCAAVARAEDVPPPVVHKQSGIAYVSGGLGEAGRQAMGKVARRYPMQLIFSLDGQSSDITGVKVVVKDALGKKQLEAVSEGPLFFFTPDSGRWTMEVEYDGESLVKTVDLTGRRYYHIEFKFKAAKQDQ